MKSTGLYLKVLVILGLVALIWVFWPRKIADQEKTGSALSVEMPAQSQNQNDNQISPEDQEDLKHLDELEKFFVRYHCDDPDNNIAGNYLEYAHHYGVDWRLLPAISVQESSCGKHQLYNNWWGFGSSSGLVHFQNIYYGMDYIMAKFKDSPYAGKSLPEILQAYGPKIEDPDHPGHYIPSPTYYKEVMGLINQIGQ